MNASLRSFGDRLEDPGMFLGDLDQDERSRPGLLPSVEFAIHGAKERKSYGSATVEARRNLREKKGILGSR